MQKHTQFRETYQEAWEKEEPHRLTSGGNFEQAAAEKERKQKRGRREIAKKAKPFLDDLTERND